RQSGRSWGRPPAHSADRWVAPSTAPSIDRATGPPAARSIGEKHPMDRGSGGRGPVKYGSGLPDGERRVRDARTDLHGRNGLVERPQGSRSGGEGGDGGRVRVDGGV